MLYLNQKKKRVNLKKLTGLFVESLNARSWVILDVSLKTRLPPVSCQILKSKPGLEILTENALTVRNSLGLGKGKEHRVFARKRKKDQGRGAVFCVLSKPYASRA